MDRRRLATAGLFAILILLLTSGCSSAKQDTLQPQRTDFTRLEAGKPVGQTFTAGYDGLNGVMVVLKPGEAPAAPGASLVLSLSEAPTGTTPLRQASLPLADVQADAYYRFNFPTLEDSGHQDYYLELDIQGQGQAWVGSGPPEAYLSGGLYQAGQALPAQLTFNLLHDWTRLTLGLAPEGLQWIGGLLAAVFLFIPPGAALLRALWPGWTTRWWIEKLGLALGVSLAFYPILLLWTDLLGLHLGWIYAWLVPLAALAWLVWDGRSDLARSWSAVRQPGYLRTRLSQAARRPSQWVPELLIIAILGLGLASRFWAIRSLDFPMYGDAYHHTMMAQLIADNGGLFDSWQPYAELSTLTYHFGFATATALLHWVTGLDMRLAILWTGQIMNGLAALALIPLAMRLHPSRWTALAVTVLVSLVFMIPMVYTRWGRYTQLAGQLILPATIFLIWEILDEQGPFRRHILSWIGLCGLALTHYRVLIFAATFYPAYFLLNLATRPLKQQIRQMFWSGVGAIVLFLPWLWTLMSGLLFKIASALMQAPVVQMASTQAEALIAETTAFVPVLFWLAMLVVVSWALWARERRLLTVALWWLLNLIITNPQWFRLGGQGMINNFTLLIAAYIPAGLILGAGVGHLAQYLTDCLAPRRALPAGARWLGWAGLAAAVLLLGAWFARQRAQDIPPALGSLATHADLRAAEWIKHSLPEEAVFLVNSFSAYDGTTIVGADGGWWLPLTTGRRTTLPPMTYTSEQGPRPDYRVWINALTETIDREGLLSPAARAMLAERGITHVYLGQQQGRVNHPEGGVDPQSLLSSPHFRLVYRQDQVYIFAFTP